jgi:hypothetical protein
VKTDKQRILLLDSRNSSGDLWYDRLKLINNKPLHVQKFECTHHKNDER